MLNNHDPCETTDSLTEDRLTDPFAPDPADRLCDWIAVIGYIALWPGSLIVFAAWVIWKSQ